MFCLCSVWLCDCCTLSCGVLWCFDLVVMLCGDAVCSSMLMLLAPLLLLAMVLSSGVCSVEQAGDVFRGCAVIIQAGS